MSNATEEVRSSRSDARGFAEAFADVDDAFTVSAAAPQSGEITLDELGDVLGLGGSAASVAPRPNGRPRAVEVGKVVGLDDELLTLDELGDVLAHGTPRSDDLEFDFGSSADQRARRRTAARLGTAELAPGQRPGVPATTGSGPAVLKPVTTAPVAAPAPAGRLREIEPEPRPTKTLGERFGGNPDRIAMWAVLLGILLILIAFTSGSTTGAILPVTGLL